MQFESSDKVLCETLNSFELSINSGGGVADVNPALVAGLATSVLAMTSPTLGPVLTATIGAWRPQTLTQAQFKVAFQDPKIAIAIINNQLKK
jgi:hypothetical protein